ANPEAVFDCWKASAVLDAPCRTAEAGYAAPASVGSGQEQLKPPVQIWACGISDHYHRAQSSAVKCLEGQALKAADPRGPPELETVPPFPLGEGPEAAGADGATTEAENSGAFDDPSGMRDEANCVDLHIDGCGSRQGAFELVPAALVPGAVGI